jgi:hypothetical protein
MNWEFPKIVRRSYGDFATILQKTAKLLQSFEMQNMAFGDWIIRFHDASGSKTVLCEEIALPGVGPRENAKGKGLPGGW